MRYREIVEEIPRPMYVKLSEKILDALLEAKDGGNVPSSLAKTVLYYAQREQLSSVAGLTNLLNALSLADPDKAVEILEEFGLEDASIALRAAE